MGSLADSLIRMISAMALEYVGARTHLHNFPHRDYFFLAIEVWITLKNVENLKFLLSIRVKAAAPEFAFCDNRNKQSASG
jgi:hypothetical protein